MDITFPKVRKINAFMTLKQAGISGTRSSILYIGVVGIGRTGSVRHARTRNRKSIPSHPPLIAIPSTLFQLLPSSLQIDDACEKSR